MPNINLNTSNTTLGLTPISNSDVRRSTIFDTVSHGSYNYETRVEIRKPYYKFLYINKECCNIKDNSFFIGLNYLSQYISTGSNVISFYSTGNDNLKFKNNLVEFDYSYAIIGNKQNCNDVLIAIIESENLW